MQPVLVAPCYTLGLLRTCGNPLCTNLDGDTEVAVVLGVAEEGEGGVVGTVMGAGVEGGTETHEAAAGPKGGVGAGGASAGASETGPMPCGAERTAVRVFCSVECRDEYRELQRCVQRWRQQPVCLDCRWRCAAQSAAGA